jgi:hypothetical protein
MDSTPSQEVLQDKIKIALEVHSQWIIDNILEENAYGCLYFGDGKAAITIYDPMQHNNYWKSLINSHVLNLPFSKIKVFKEAEPDKILFYSGNGIGIRFGGTMCPMGRCLCRSYALDCDCPNAQELLPIAMEHFPDMVFFQKYKGEVTDGRWHAHGRLSSPVNYHQINAWLDRRKAEIPALNITKLEVFPKADQHGKDNKLGSYIRLPLTEQNGYFPVGVILKPIPITDVQRVNDSVSTLPKSDDKPLPDVVTEIKDDVPPPNIVIPFSDKEETLYRLKLDNLLKESKWIRDGFTGDYNPPVGQDTTISAYDFRFVRDLIHEGIDDRRFLLYALKRRIGTRDVNDFERYCDRIIDRNLRSTVKGKFFSQKTPIQVREDDLTNSWLFNSTIWKTRMLGDKAQKIYFKHLQLGFQGKLDSLDWSQEYFIGCRSLSSMNCGALGSIKKAHAYLIRLNLIRLVSKGSQHKANTYQVRIVQKDEEEGLIKQIPTMKEQYILDIEREKQERKLRKDVTL